MRFSSFPRLRIPLILILSGLIVAGGLQLLNVTKIDAANQGVQILRAHTANVMSVGFTQDGKSVITAGLDGIIRVWDRNSETWTRNIVGDVQGIRYAAVSPSGSQILSGGYDQKVRLWDIDTETMIVELGRHMGPIYCVDISPTGEMGVSVGQDHQVLAWDLVKRRSLWTHVCDDPSSGTLYSVAFAPEGNEVAVGCEDGAVLFLDTETGERLDVIADHPVAIMCVVYSRDGKYVFTSGSTNRIWMWDRAEKKLVREFIGHLGSIRTISVSDDGKRLISGSFDRTVRFWDVESGEVIQVLRDNNEAVYSVALSPDGKTGIAGSYDGTVRLWDMANAEERYKLERPTESAVP